MKKSERVTTICSLSEVKMLLAQLWLSEEFWKKKETTEKAVRCQQYKEKILKCIIGKHS